MLESETLPTENLPKKFVAYCDQCFGGMMDPAATATPATLFLRSSFFRGAATVGCSVPEFTRRQH